MADPGARARLSDLALDLGLEYADLPGNVLAHFLRRAAILACGHDLCPREARPRIRGDGGRVLLLPPGGDEEVHAVLGFRALPTPEAPCPERTRRYCREPASLGDGATALWLSGPGEVSIRRPAGLAWPGLYEVAFSARPTRDAQTIDARLASDHLEVLLDGARWLIHGVSGKPWSQPALAEAHRARFLQGLGQAKALWLSGRQRGLQRLAGRRIV
jgi:hypothetical protein